MLNPANWLESGKMIDAFLSPILLESSIHLLLPCFINTALVIFLWTFYKKRTELEPDGYYHKMNKFTGGLGASLALLQPLSGLSFFLKVKSTSPMLSDPTPIDQILSGVATPFFYTMISLAGIAVVSIIIYWVKGHERGAVLLIIATAALYTAFFMGAYTRERARKPFLVHSVMTMDMRIINTPKVQTDKIGGGLKGADIFAEKNCFACHVIEGKGGSFGPELIFSELNDKYTPDSIKAFMKNPGGNMPAFDGTDEELEVLNEYLLNGNSQ
ncbi:MAG: cytochrome c [Spirochaetaceae bacterium]|nr:cytochrome c [Spirochaetaceae bacterium]